MLQAMQLLCTGRHVGRYLKNATELLIELLVFSRHIDISLTAITAEPSEYRNHNVVVAIHSPDVYEKLTFSKSRRSGR